MPTPSDTILSWGLQAPRFVSGFPTSWGVSVPASSYLLIFSRRLCILWSPFCYKLRKSQTRYLEQGGVEFGVLEFLYPLQVRSSLTASECTLIWKSRWVSWSTVSMWLSPVCIAITKCLRLSTLWEKKHISAHGLEAEKFEQLHVIKTSWCVWVQKMDPRTEKGVHSVDSKHGMALRHQNLVSR